MDAVLLSRIQFAINIGFHFIFPPISIGLVWLLVIAEYHGWRKNDETTNALGSLKLTGDRLISVRGIRVPKQVSSAVLLDAAGDIVIQANGSP